MKKVLVLSLIVLIAAAVFAVWQLQKPATAAALLLPDDSVIVKEGAAIYAQQCAACHGVDLEGQPNWRQMDENGRLPAPPHDETGHTWHHSDALLFAITKFGTAKAAGLEDYESDMPAYEGVLTDAEIVAVLSFIKSRWPSEVRERHDALTAQ